VGRPRDSPLHAGLSVQPPKRGLVQKRGAPGLRVGPAQSAVARVLLAQRVAGLHPGCARPLLWPAARAWISRGWWDPKFQEGILPGSLPPQTLGPTPGPNNPPRWGRGLSKTHPTGREIGADGTQQKEPRAGPSRKRAPPDRFEVRRSPPVFATEVHRWPRINPSWLTGQEMWEAGKAAGWGGGVMRPMRPGTQGVRITQLIPGSARSPCRTTVRGRLEVGLGAW